MVVLLPALFLVMFLGVQAALMAQGRAILMAAAQEGARTAAAEHSTAALGSSTAREYVLSSSTGLSNVAVTANRTAARASVTVRATTLSVIPGWDPVIEQSATMPVERLT